MPSMRCIMCILKWVVYVFCRLLFPSPLSHLPPLRVSLSLFFLLVCKMWTVPFPPSEACLLEVITWVNFSVVYLIMMCLILLAIHGNDFCPELSALKFTSLFFHKVSAMGESFQLGTSCLAKLNFAFQHEVNWRLLTLKTNYGHDSCCGVSFLSGFQRGREFAIHFVTGIAHFYSLLL